MHIYTLRHSAYKSMRDGVKDIAPINESSDNDEPGNLETPI